ncbi:hypothetical protein AX15_005310 [Amanita polypyramis BW_CC]|nr:hypothetical protein AX15_005310 [Amanita polypyramis BW_CC]
MQDHLDFLLSREWLVKVDNERSTPYLFKFYSSTVDLSCSLIVTDTKSVWTEALTSKQFARRWRTCNNLPEPEAIGLEDEDTWRTTNLQLLSNIHSLGAISDVRFQVLESNYSDFSFQLECDTFQWRWETNYLGYKRSSEIISKQIILPLISLTHVAFTSTESLAAMPDGDIEKVVDRVGRTARRTIDTHIKHAISMPRVATTIRRMTSIFNFASELPAVVSTAEKPSLDPETRIKPSRKQKPTKRRSISPITVHTPRRQSPAPLPEQRESQKKLDCSATESEPDTSPDKSECAAPERSSPSVPPQSRRHPTIHPSRYAPPMPLESTAEGPIVSATASDPESSPGRPMKKHKGPMSSDADEDSEEERRKHLAQLRSGNGPSVAKRGVRQPIKRGGKRF